MHNFIGVGVWIVIGIIAALLVKAIVKRPEDDAPSGTLLLLVLSAFGAVIGGMLGVGIFHLREPIALSRGGIGGAVFLALLMASLYRWGIRGLT
ncbi:MAG: hypothetical protein HY704_11500 [Gemmatimonadetes bacterium]|nr:hypothetical protein [Gemmatimonadota bacterium]